MRWQLVVDQGHRKGQIIPIQTARFLIGRNSACQLRPAAASVSRRHCLLTIRDGRLFAADCRTRNGTFVNGGRLCGEQELHSGDHLGFGPLDFIVKSCSKREPILRGGALDEDEIARMLLHMDEPAEGKCDGYGGPAVDTVAVKHELACNDTLPEHRADQASAQSAESCGTSGRNTTNAAQDILSKYMRRSAPAMSKER